MPIIPKTVYAFALPDVPDALTLLSSFYRFPYTQYLKGDRFSTIVFQPIEMIESWGGRITVTNRDQQLTIKKPLMDIISQRLDVWGQGTVMDDPLLPPFQGGAVGYMGFDYNMPHIEAEDVPHAAFGIYDQCISFDHQENLAWYVVVATDAGQARQKYQHFQRLSARSYMPPADAQQPGLSWAPVNEPAEAKNNVRRTSDLIHSGAFNQSFLCQYFESAIPAGYDMLAHYRDVQGTGPGACQAFGGVNVFSLAMETILTITGRQVEVTHISHRSARPEGSLRDDAALQSFSENGTSFGEHRKQAKDATVRLSSFCRADGILGPSTAAARKSGSSYHIQSITRGIMADRVTPADLMTLFMPHADFSGQPADRVCRSLSGMESRMRGPAFGYTATLGFNGTMSFSLNRNSLISTGAVLRYAEGGAVTASTDPDTWYDELMIKANENLERLSPPNPDETAARAG